MTEPFPWLSEECLYTEGLDPRWCGLCASTEDSVVWREHDERDKPTTLFVVLCGPCGSKVIDAHPRFFSRVPTHAPAPGVMPICFDCRWRAGTFCLHPSSRYVDGEGMGKLLEHPEPWHCFVDGTDKRGRRVGWTEVRWTGPVTACGGRQPTDLRPQTFSLHP